MNYYFIEKSFLAKEYYRFTHNLPSALVKSYVLGEMNLPPDEVLQEVAFEAGEVKDFLNEGNFLIVSEKMKIALDEFSHLGNYTFFPIDLIYIKNGSKAAKTLRYFLFQIPARSFFDYENSEYDGDEADKLIFSIDKLKIRVDALEGLPIVRFKELGGFTLINENVKERLELLKLNGLKFISTEEFTF